MTNELTTKNQQVSARSLPELGLRLLAERFSVKVVQTPEGGRQVVHVDLPPLTADERMALLETRGLLALALQPGRRAHAIALLARLANHRPKDRTAAEWQMLFEDYAEDLAEFSDAHVAEAIGEHRRNSNFFPTIAELRTRCSELVQRDRFRLERCERLLADPAKAPAPKAAEENVGTRDAHAIQTELANRWKAR